MTNWRHRHVIDLASFSLEDYREVLALADRFRETPSTGARRLPALQGHLITTLFFEPSTRTKSSFELAARRLSADVQSFTPTGSSLGKGESLLDTSLTYHNAPGYKGDADAQCCMGLFYEGVLCENWEEMPKDYQKAMNWYLLSATQRDATAQNNLGLMYYQGLGTPKNYKEALRLFRLAAEQRYIFAQYKSGLT